MTAWDHPGDLLSALLDGELTEAEAVAVRGHVEECTACADDLDNVREARRLVRELPAVEPPATFLAALAAPDVVVPLDAHRRARRWLAPVAAAAAVMVVGGGALVALRPDGDSTLDPDVEVAVEHHASTVDALEDDGVLRPAPQRLSIRDDAPPTTAARQSLRDLPGDLLTPHDLGDYELIDAYEADDGVHLLYTSGPYALSIIEREGEIDFGDLPVDGEQLSIAGHRAWRWSGATDGRVIVVELDDVVLTVIGDEPGGAVLDAARAFVLGGR